MKNHFSFKRNVSITFSVSVLVLVIYSIMMLHYNESFSVEMIVGLVKPLAVVGVFMSILSSIFFFFPEKIFNSWLKKIAWWYGLGLFLITANTPVFSSNILSASRSETVFWGMILLGLISVTFIYFERRRV